MDGMGRMRATHSTRDSVLLHRLCKAKKPLCLLLTLHHLMEQWERFSNTHACRGTHRNRYKHTLTITDPTHQESDEMRTGNLRTQVK